MPASATVAARLGSSPAPSSPDGDGNGRPSRFCLLQIANTPWPCPRQPPNPCWRRDMDVKLVNIDEVRPYEANPRINDQAVEAVANSLREFGFRQPIVVDEQNVIIVGHTRWK